MRADIRKLTQIGVGTAPIDEGAARFARTTHIGDFLDSMTLQVIEEVIDIAMIPVEIGLVAKSERISQC